MFKSLLKYKLRNNFFLERELLKVERLFNLDSRALCDYENDCFIKLFKRAITLSPFYKLHYQKHGISIDSIRGIDDIRKLPPIGKEIVRNEGRQMLTIPRIFFTKGYTSGTTGSPLEVYRSLKSVIVEQSYQLHFRMTHGWNEGDPIVSMRGVLGRGQTHKYDKVENVLYISSYNINQTNILLYKKLIDDFKPKLILAYPSSLELLCNELDYKKLTVNIPVAITSSETLYDFQRLKAQNLLGSQVFDWYGNAERTIAIAEYESGKYYFVPGYGIAEKENGKIYTTSLINSDFPLIRYEVGDNIEWDNSTDPEDLTIGLKRIKQITGREDDIIILKDGTKIGRLDIAFKGIRNIKNSQIIQDIIGEIRVNIVPVNSPFDSRALEVNLKKLLGENILINFCEVTNDAIERSAAGKYKLVINKLFKK